MDYNNHIIYASRAGMFTVLGFCYFMFLQLLAL